MVLRKILEEILQCMMYSRTLIKCISRINRFSSRRKDISLLMKIKIIYEKLSTSDNFVSIPFEIRPGKYAMLLRNG